MNANPEILRHYLVDYEGKKVIEIHTDKVSLYASAEQWETLFPEITEEIRNNIKGDLVDILTADFSTTTSVERIASQITVMEAMNPYLEFVVIYGVCGIPEITLEGTPEDWQKVLTKTEQLSRYDLAWWTDELKPILKEFIRASKGEIDRSFWRNMFKYHSGRRYGSPTVIDGWIVKFFPYNSDGKRNGLDNMIREIDNEQLPEEIVKVDIKYINAGDGSASEETMLELWAGFIGLEQDKETYALTPQIGWMVRKKDVHNSALERKFETDGFIHIRAAEIPEALLWLKNIRSLSIDFTDRILIPERLAGIEIEYLYLRGRISPREKRRIRRMFPDTSVTINGKTITHPIPAVRGPSR